MQASELSIKNDISELKNIHRLLDELAAEWKLNEDDVFDIRLVVEEIITNIIHYAFEDDQTHHISLKFLLKENELRIVIKDYGKEFNPSKAPDPDDLETNIEDRKIGGLGIYFVKSLMDGIDYKRRFDQNDLTLIKKLKSPIK